VGVSDWIDPLKFASFELAVHLGQHVKMPSLLSTSFKKTNGGFKRVSRGVNPRRPLAKCRKADRDPSVWVKESIMNRIIEIARPYVDVYLAAATDCRTINTGRLVTWSVLDQAERQGKLEGKFLELMAGANPATAVYIDRALKEGLVNMWPRGFLKVKNCGGFGDSRRGPWSAYREVRPSGELFLACLGVWGSKKAEAGLAEMAAINSSPPPTVTEERLWAVDTVRFENLDFSSSKPEYLGQNQEWFRRLLAGNTRLGYFNDPDDKYSLIGYFHDNEWHMIPVPVFWRIWPKHTLEVNGMSFAALPYFQMVFPRMTVRPRGEWERAQG